MMMRVGGGTLVIWEGEYLSYHSILGPEVNLPSQDL